MMPPFGNRLRKACTVAAQLLLLGGCCSRGCCSEGCSCTSSAADMASRPEAREASDRVESPASGPVKRAWVLVRVREVDSEKRLYEVRQELQLETTSGVKPFLIASFTESATFHEKGTRKLLTGLAHESFELVFAPDGHALALSSDKGETWDVVALDAGEPLHCMHLSLPSKSGDGDDIWAAAPSTRDLALRLLSARAIGEYHEDWGAETSAELRRAERFACSHKDDAELAMLFASYVTGPTRTWEDDDDFVVECLRDSMKKHAEVGQFLRETMSNRGEPTARGRAVAAQALAWSADASFEESLAREAIRATFFGPETHTEDRDSVAQGFTEALSIAVQARKEASEPVLAALLALTCRRNAAHPSRVDSMYPASVREAGVRAFLVLGPDTVHRAQEVLASTLLDACEHEPDFADYEDRRNLAWATAALVRKVPPTSPSVEKALSAAARYRDPARSIDATMSFGGIRAYGALGLGMLATDSARAILEELAAKECTTPVQDSTDADAFWAAPTLEQVHGRPVACWAKIALQG
jgi:hypothetical protein